MDAVRATAGELPRVDLARLDEGDHLVRPASHQPLVDAREPRGFRGPCHETGTCAASASLRYWWTKATHMLPSPTAEATRLTGPNRTSPQAKMPGTLVSRRYGSRASVQRPVARISEPVSTEPCSSSATSGGSQSVWASAPMKM